MEYKCSEKKNRSRSSTWRVLVPSTSRSYAAVETHYENMSITETTYTKKYKYVNYEFGKYEKKCKTVWYSCPDYAGNCIEEHCDEKTGVCENMKFD